MEILNVCGLSRRIAALFRPLLRRLLPNASRDEETLAAVSANVSANLLGLGNAATPLGIQAARRMARNCGGAASDELCLLVDSVMAQLPLERPRVALSGGVIENNVWVQTRLLAALAEKHPELETVLGSGDALKGACMLARE